MSRVKHNEDNNEHKINLFPRKSNNDWTHAIHQKFGIKRRTCTTFIPKITKKTEVNDARCGCNRLRREHSWDVIAGNESEWDEKKHTKSAFNNAYGFLPNSGIHYVRCDIETKPAVLAQFVLEIWNVPPPRLIMCIIGGAKYFKLNERLEKEFIKGIIQVALKADGWIVTSGFNTGVVQLVGEAIHDHKVTNPRSHITAIACSKWGATRNREELVLKKPSLTQNTDVSFNSSKNEKGQQALELNHTHFLLLDDGTYYGYEIGDYRTRFVTEVSKYHNTHVPIVTIVVEGGPDTLSAIYNDLRTGIPVVLVDGSGRIPNLLANFLTHTAAMIKRNEKSEDGSMAWKDVIDIQESEKLRTLFCQYEEEIRNGLKSISKGSRTSEKQMERLLDYFLYCLQPTVRNNIQIYSLDSDHDFDDTIFEAIIQVKQKKCENNSGQNRAQLLKLALAWDAIEIAKIHIIKEDLSDLNFATKEELLFIALILDRPQFVNAFLKLDFNLPEMFYERQTNKPWKLKWEQLAKLYTDTEKKKKERLYLLGKCCKRDIAESEYELDQVLRTLVGDYMKPIYTNKSIHMLQNFDICCKCSHFGRVSDCQTCLHPKEDESESEFPDPEEAEKDVEELVYRDLFIWCILTNRIEMSKVILTHNETKDVLICYANQFEEYANESLKCCYNYDEERACEIAIRQINIFGGVSCLQVAVDADNKNFVGQPCCDQLLNNIWYDKIEPFQTGTFKTFRLLLSICSFGLLAPILIQFRKDLSTYVPRETNDSVEIKINQHEENVQLPSRPQKRLNDLGINYSDNCSNWSQKPTILQSRYIRCLKHFHESPIIKFAYHCLSYIVFLLLFSYYLLFGFKIPQLTSPNIHWTEICVIIIITTMLIEETRQFFSQENRTIIGKLSNYFIKNQFSSLIRVTSYLLFYIGLILRFTNTYSEEAFSAAKIVLAYDLEVWFIRSLSFLGIAQNMGPKLVMIRKMIIDLFFFTYIILTAVVAYGVVSRAIYNYSTIVSFDGQSIFQNIIYPTYYLLYGNIGDELKELDANPNSNTAIATHVLLAFHMLFVNILLINLLIAMFSFTFQSVQTQTDLVWRYERYSLIHTYFDQPPLFPPFILITHVIRLIKLVHLRLSKHTKRIQTKMFKMMGNSREVDKGWSEFESYATNLHARSLLANQTLSTSVANSSNMFTDKQTISDTAMYNTQLQSNASQYDAKLFMEEVGSLRKSLIDLRTQSEEMHRCMHWMMDAMDRVKMSKEPKPRLKSAVTTER